MYIAALIFMIYTNVCVIWQQFLTGTLESIIASGIILGAMNYFTYRFIKG